LCLGGSAPAAEGELGKPYRLQVVLHVARHPLLTEVFREQVRRELSDGLQAALGELARVEVVAKHPRLPDVLGRGLERSLDEWKERSDVKTHFVLLDYSGGHYEIRARQYDGVVGVPSPVVRHDRRRDRAFVAKAAAQLIQHDFGLIGTVLTEPPPGGLVKVDGGVVKVELRGGGLDAPLEPWVKTGDVFALVQAPPGNAPALPVPDAVLQVQKPPDDKARDGVCDCRLLHRYELPRAAGLRCIKLGTTQAPVRLRLVKREPDGTTGPLDHPRSVQIRRHGFSNEATTMIKIPTGANGTVDTSRVADGVFDRLAFVSVIEGADKLQAQVPVALVADRLVVVPISAAQAGNYLLELQVQGWKNEVSNSMVVQVRLFEELQKLGANPEQRAAALTKAREGLKRSEGDYARLQAARNELLKEAPGRKLDLPEDDRRLTELKNGQTALRQFIEEQEKINKEENSPERKALLDKVARAKLLEQDAELEQALKLYREALAGGLKDEELRSYVEDLQKLWTPIDEKDSRYPKFMEARTFIYNTWPGLDAAGLKERMGDALKALEACEQAKDIIGPLKLFKTTVAHADRLRQEREKLKPELHPDDEKPAETIREVSPKLKKLAEDINTYLNKKQSAGK
jgi:hypothetical protein